MNDQTHKLTPEEPFPSDLTVLEDFELELLNSRLHRELDVEYLEVDPQAETESRLAEVNQELDRRERHRAASTEIRTSATITQPATARRGPSRQAGNPDARGGLIPASAGRYSSERKGQ